MRQNTKGRARQTAKQKNKGPLWRVFIITFVVCLAVEFIMLVRIGDQAAASRAVEADIRNLSATVDNINLSLNQLKATDRISERATALHMTQPTKDQIRVVHLPGELMGTSAQSAENIVTEEMQ